jgi:hypothetical protein
MRRPSPHRALPDVARQSGWPFWRSRREDDCRGATIGARATQVSRRPSCRDRSVQSARRAICPPRKIVECHVAQSPSFVVGIAGASYTRRCDSDPAATVSMCYIMLRHLGARAPRSEVGNFGCYASRPACDRKFNQPLRHQIQTGAEKLLRRSGRGDCGIGDRYGKNQSRT